jgi:hypothetical protein
MASPSLAAGAASFLARDLPPCHVPCRPLRLVSNRNQRRRSALSIGASEQAGGGDVAVIVARIVGGAEAGRERAVVVPQLGQHVLGVDVRGVVVHALQAGHVADRAQRQPAQLAQPPARTFVLERRAGEFLVYSEPA